jgi:glycosyltransferase involved in cell wall biosynthesis
MAPTVQVSIITSTLNPGDHLLRLADHLVTAPPLFEWIIVDGASTDGTQKRIESLGGLVRTWLSEPDDSIYDAWNKGLARAHGRWVMFLGVDDRLGRNWLNYCANAPDVDLVYGDLARKDVDGRCLGVTKSPPWVEARRRLRYHMSLPHPGLAHNQRLFAERRFNPTFRISGDFHFLATANVSSAERVDDVQAIMALGGVSNSPLRVRQAYKENCRVLAELRSRMPFWDIARWATKIALSAVAPSFYPTIQSWTWRLRRVVSKRPRGSE